VFVGRGGILLLGSTGTVNAAEFDADYYAAQNPDVVAVVGMDAEALRVHYQTFGAAEGRLANAADVSAVSFADFDAVYYAELNPDVVAVFGNDPMSLYTHYLVIGRSEGRAPNAAVAAAVKSGKSYGEVDPYARFSSGGGSSKHSHHSSSGSDSKSSKSESQDNVSQIDLDGLLVYLDILYYDKDGNEAESSSTAAYRVIEFRELNNEECTLEGKPIPEGYQVRVQIYSWDDEGNEVILADKYLNNPNMGNDSSIEIHLDDLVSTWKKSCPGSSGTEVTGKLRAYVADSAGNEVGANHSFSFVKFTVEAETEEKTEAAETKEEIEAVKTEVKTEVAETEKEIEAVKTEVKTEAAETEEEIEAVKTEVKTEVAETEEEIEAVKTEVKTEVAETEEEIEAVKTEVKTEAAETEEEIEAVKTEAKEIYGEVKEETGEEESKKENNQQED